MLRGLIVLSLVFLVSVCAHAQQIIKCDLDLLGRIEVNVQGLTKKDIRDFLLTFDNSCKSNTEYSEFSNELLFEVLYEQPAVLIQVLDNEKAKLDTDLILDNLSNPVNNLIEIDQVLARVQRVKSVSTVKNLVILKLKVAQDKGKKP